MGRTPSKKDKKPAESEAEQALARPCDIRYKVECEDTYGPSFEVEQADKPFDLTVEKNVIQAKGPAPVFEIVTKLEVATKLSKFKWGGLKRMGTWGMGGAGKGGKEDWGKDFDVQSAFQGSAFNGMGGMGGGFPGMYPGGYLDDSSSSEEEVEETDDEGVRQKVKKKKPAPKPTLENKRINKVGQTRMVIHSPWLLSVIRDVIKYYPGQNLTGETIIVHEPYHALMHHITEFRDFHSRLSLEKGAGTEDEQEETSTKYDHLKVLLDYLEPHVERTILPAHRRLKKDVSTTTWDDMWYLLRPGALSYAKKDDHWLGVVVDSVEKVEEPDKKDWKWRVMCWLLDHSWTSAHIDRAELEIEIPFFEGEKVVTELPVHPCEYMDKTDGGKQRKQITDRGRKARDVLWQGHLYQHYDGRVLDKDKTTFKGPVVFDAHKPWWASVKENEWSLSWCYDSDEFKGVLYDNCHFHTNNVPREIKKVEFWADKDSTDDFSDDHMFLLTPVIIGFSLTTKEWLPLNVDCMSDIVKPKFTPDANIAAENLSIIKALSYRQTKSKLTWSADFIKSKGEGVVVLMHGPPGVGKTYTVETTAIHTQRPLVALTIGDLGSNESSIEEELSRWFDLATRWRAVLLIDEADIFLEKRRTSDLARNGVVTAFLRRMEYFGGLLFLTTNRIDSMDDAFMSRVHVIIGFEKLNPQTRVAIWKSFFDKLAGEMEQIRVTDEAKRYVLDDEEMMSMDWNGREIRNAFQTAIALAEYESSEKEGWKEEDGVVVDAEHFRKVMEISKKFRTYVDKVKGKETGDKSEDSSEWGDVN